MKTNSYKNENNRLLSFFHHFTFTLSVSLVYNMCFLQTEYIVTVVYLLIMSDSCHLMDYSLPGSTVHGIFQARILEWVAMTEYVGSYF